MGDDTTHHAGMFFKLKEKKCNKSRMISGKKYLINWWLYIKNLCYYQSNYLIGHYRTFLPKALHVLPNSGLTSRSKYKLHCCNFNGEAIKGSV